jgi:hypothetical protein
MFRKCGIFERETNEPLGMSGGFRLVESEAFRDEFSLQPIGTSDRHG